MQLPKNVAVTLGGIAILLAATACSAVTTEPAPTTAAQPGPPVQAVATTAAAPAQSNAPVPAGAVRLSLLPGQSTASYVVGEQLAGRALPNDAVGTTSGVAGTLVIGADGAVAPGSKITVDLTTLRSDESRRDNFVKSNVLQTGKYPIAEFVPTAVEGLAQPLPASGQVDFTLTGDLTVHGATRPVTWDVVAEVDGSQVSGTALTTMTFADFGMTAPKVGPVLRVDEELLLQLDFQAERAPA
jgi:polyisoprenoid-binding protein YceI